MASCPFRKRLRNGHAFHRQKIKLLYASDRITMYFWTSVRLTLVPSRYFCVFGVREDWGLSWGGGVS